ncbi:MAG: hypothetical protein L6R36_005381 [Xanthoria steineri]|nr:MAG: hypothetical protein L6R36_005381 [Xanthoria steineri]
MTQSVILAPLSVYSQTLGTAHRILPKFHRYLLILDPMAQKQRHLLDRHRAASSRHLEFLRQESDGLSGSIIVPTSFSMGFEHIIVAALTGNNDILHLFPERQPPTHPESRRDGGLAILRQQRNQRRRTALTQAAQHNVLGTHLRDRALEQRMHMGARSSQPLDLQICPLVGGLQGPVVEPLGDDGAVVDLGATFGCGGEDELGLWERGSECLR